MLGIIREAQPASIVDNVTALKIERHVAVSPAMQIVHFMSAWRVAQWIGYWAQSYPEDFSEATQVRHTCRLHRRCASRCRPS